MIFRKIFTQGFWLGLLAVLLVFTGCSGVGMTAQGPENGISNAGVSWPPKLGESYPDITVLGADGKALKLSSFRGKVLMIEPVGMTCPACQAFAGAHQRGGYSGVTPAQGLQSMETYFPQYTGGVAYDDPRIVHIQLLLYSMSMTAPTADDVRQWSAHFFPHKPANVYVVAGSRDLLGMGSYNMIPGFQLVDRRFVLRADSTGHQPKDDLFGTLLPMVPTVLAEE